MHPLGNEGAFRGRSRSNSLADSQTTPMATTHQPPQMTYFLADEKSMEASIAQSSTGRGISRENLKHSNFGVESLETTIGSLPNQDNDEQDGSLGKARNNRKRGPMRGTARKSEEDLAPSRSPSPRTSQAVSRDLSPSEPRPRRSPKPSSSLPLSPMTIGSPIAGSMASSPSSRRNSETDFFMDDVASQAIQSSGDEEPEVPSEVMDSSSASQLVMPSIMMPSRRPFTEKGRNLGKLKVLIAGDCGMFL
jgi:hypothetical protein